MVGFGLELMCKISQKKIGEGKKDHDTNTTQGGIKNPLGSIDFWSQILENAVLFKRVKFWQKLGIMKWEWLQKVFMI